MGHSIGDFNQDGFMDIFLSAIYWTNTTCQMASCAFGSVGSGYYQNNGNGTFKDMTKEVRTSAMLIFSKLNLQINNTVASTLKANLQY